MSFAEILKQHAPEETGRLIDSCTEQDVFRALAATTPSVADFAALLSPAALPHLEAMAREARDLTIRYFGRTIQLFTPLYLSDHCSNHCVYCGFNAKNKLNRSSLTMEQIRAEAEAIASTGLKHLLILTGEAPKKAGVDYLVRSMDVLRRFFPSVSIEVFAMKTEEYKRMVDAGVDGLTLFQETYNSALYKTLHPAGPKRDFDFRLDAPERGCMAGMRTVGIGALLGLDEWRRDLFLTGLHAQYLMHKYPGTDIGVSLPRIRTFEGQDQSGFKPTCTVSDRETVQALTALRIFLPRVGVTISTRESISFRDNILPLGVTRMSAGVSTAVGGHAGNDDRTGQFDISDPRSVDEMCGSLREHGFQPVFKDWEPLTAQTERYAP